MCGQPRCRLRRGQSDSEDVRTTERAAFLLPPAATSRVLSGIRRRIAGMGIAPSKRGAAMSTSLAPQSQGADAPIPIPVPTRVPGPTLRGDGGPSGGGSHGSQNFKLLKGMGPQPPAVPIGDSASAPCTKQRAHERPSGNYTAYSDHEREGSWIVHSVSPGRSNAPWPLAGAAGAGPCQVGKCHWPPAASRPGAGRMY